MAKKKKTTRRKKPAAPPREFHLPMPAIVRENPLDSMGLALAIATAGVITMNALLMQGPATAAVHTDQHPASVAPIMTPDAGASSSSSLSSSPSSSITVRPEAPSMLVLEVQSELQRRGIYDGPADGVFGPKTETAIAAYEAKIGLKPTGRPNPQVLAALRAADAAPVASSRVMSVQRVLSQQGFGPVKIDGVSGEGTRAAIRRFEASRGLPQKGEITPEFLSQLSRVSGASFD